MGVSYRGHGRGIEENQSWCETDNKRTENKINEEEVKEDMRLFLGRTKGCFGGRGVAAGGGRRKWAE